LKLHLKQESRAVAGKPRDAAVNFDTKCLGTIDRSAASVARKGKGKVTVLPRADLGHVRSVRSNRAARKLGGALLDPKNSV